VVFELRALRRARCAMVMMMMTVVTCDHPTSPSLQNARAARVV